jgi:hypothetical protein
LAALRIPLGAGCGHSAGFCHGTVPIQGATTNRDHADIAFTSASGQGPSAQRKTDRHAMSHSFTRSTSNMTTPQLTYLMPFVAAAITALLGLLALFQPERARRWYGVATDDLGLVRRHWGGGPLASSAFCLYWQAPSAFFGLGMVWLGLAVTRLAQWRAQPVAWKALGVEALMAAGMLAGLVAG